jgi:hypothetical protein
MEPLTCPPFLLLDHRREERDNGPWATGVTELGGMAQLIQVARAQFVDTATDAFDRRQCLPA